MREFITVTLDTNEEAVQIFAAGFYKNGTINRNFRGIRITYMNGEHKGKRSFDIAKPDILTIRERALEIANKQ